MSHRKSYVIGLKRPREETPLEVLHDKEQAFAKDSFQETLPPGMGFFVCLFVFNYYLAKKRKIAEIAFFDKQKQISSTLYDNLRYSEPIDSQIAVEDIFSLLLKRVDSIACSQNIVQGSLEIIASFIDKYFENDLPLLICDYFKKFAVLNQNISSSDVNCSASDTSSKPNNSIVLDTRTSVLFPDQDIILTKFGKIPSNSASLFTHWMFTIVKPSGDDLSGISINECFYSKLIVGHFKMICGTSYIRGFISLRERKSYTFIKKNLHNCAKWYHIGVQSIIDVINFCKESDDYQELVPNFSSSSAGKVPSNVNGNTKVNTDINIHQFDEKAILKLAYSKDTWLEAAELLSIEIPKLFFENAVLYKKIFHLLKEEKSSSI